MTEITGLRARLEQDIIANREEEALGRKKKFKVESEVENWIHKYDQDLEEKQAEIDEITVIYNQEILLIAQKVLFLEEKAHLDELQSQYSELQKEYESILQHQKLIEAEKKVSSI